MSTGQHHTATSKSGSAAEKPSKEPILVVDDDPIVRTVVATVLEMEDYRVVQATDGREALVAARRSKPGLIVLDVAMPEVDGFEVCRKLRSDPQTAKTPVLILSGRGEQEDAELARRLGADAYLTKPFTSVGLVEVVRQLVGE